MLVGVIAFENINEKSVIGLDRHKVNIQSAFPVNTEKILVCGEDSILPYIVEWIGQRKTDVSIFRGNYHDQGDYAQYFRYQDLIRAVE